MPSPSVSAAPTISPPWKPPSPITSHPPPMLDLSGKVALVTGASRGIGRAIASRLAAQGALVVAAARGEHAADSVADITGRGQRAEALSLDVTDAAALERVPAGIVERHGRLDILVSNAGINRKSVV